MDGEAALGSPPCRHARPGPGPGGGHADEGHLGALLRPPRNISINGMLLASPVRLANRPELELEFNLPEGRNMLRALGRVVRDAPEIAWPYLGYGVEFLFVPPDSIEAIGRDGRLPPPPRHVRGPRRRSGLPCAASRGSTRSSSRLPPPERLAVGDPSRAPGGLAARTRQAPSTSWKEGPRKRRWPRPAPSSFATADVPRVSVLLPVRDAAPHPRECLASLADQTLADHEVVAVDDGSRDGSREILAAAARPTRGCAWSSTRQARAASSPP